MSETPGKKKVQKLLEGVQEGSYVIPHFQRDFEWQPGMVCDLIESILQDYFSGLLLFWELDQGETDLSRWDPVWGADKKKPKWAILDGQQRMASLYYSLFNPNKTFPKRKTYYTFYLDLIKVLNGDFEDSVSYRYSKTHQPWESLEKKKSSWISDGKIPLPVLTANDPKDKRKDYLNSKDFENWINNFLDTNKTKLNTEKSTFDVHRLLTKITSYEFVFFTLSSNREVYDVCNIFAKINQKGMRLSTFDLMNAFLYPKGVELRKTLWENLDNESLKQVDGKMSEYLLKAISLFKQNYCSSKYIYNLIPGPRVSKLEGGKRVEVILVDDGDAFTKLWINACKYSEKAREKIMNTGPKDFGAIKHNFIPNTTIVPVLGAILWKYKGDPDSDAFNKMLQKWYWSSVGSERYSGSSDSVMAKDVRDWIEHLTNSTKIDLDSRVKTSIDNLDLKNTSKGSARYNAILCLIALKGARDFYSGRIVGSGDFTDQNINDHHIFPSQVRGLELDKSKLFNDYKNSIVNRTLILDQTNIKIQNKKPSVYVGELRSKLGNEKTVKKVMETHLINENAYEFMKIDDFDNFIKEREKTIENYVKTIL